MSRRVFLDVGAHYGESAEVALDPGWGFARVHCFEPAAGCRRILARYRDPRLRVEPFGLSNRTGPATLFGAGLLGASVYADKRQPGVAVREEPVHLVRASDWLAAGTAPDDEVYLKLNCEGSECDVLEDLLDTGLVARVRALYVDFDVRKVPSQAYRQAGVERRLREWGVGYATPETVGEVGSRAVARWLARDCPRVRRGRGALRYGLRLHRPPYLWCRSAARAALPAPAFRWAAARFGAASRNSGDGRLSDL